jgi:hypothetical protein
VLLAPIVLMQHTSSSTNNEQCSFHSVFSESVKIMVLLTQKQIKRQSAANSYQHYY